MMRNMKLEHLGGLTAKQFLGEYWQKKPLLVRQAFPGFQGLLTPEELAGLACEEDTQSRLVLRQRGQWKLEQGPFDEARFARLPKKDWSLLVQGVNHFLPQAAELLAAFDFIPRARLDDLMVSYAPDGGGVGPHFDSYDVFLLQGHGKRLWRVSTQKDMELLEGAPLRILKNFHAEQEWLLEPGDMLYLPPRAAHWGIAVGPCMTYSVGFRALSAQELATQFLAWLAENVCLDGMYADPDLKPPRHAAEISGQMLKKTQSMLRSIRWDEAEVAAFLGSYLTEPKPHILFNPPRRLTPEKFGERFTARGIRLDLKSQMLFNGNHVFINGESAQVQGAALNLMTTLADRRALPATGDAPPQALALLCAWRNAGYLDFS
ncbi:MAG: cupin domain-containing protein [Nitrosomonadales bacterium]|nr:MAG: cupin domain-containing protein [Nitrosomonadales bacterium]